MLRVLAVLLTLSLPGAFVLPFGPDAGQSESSTDEAAPLAAGGHVVAFDVSALPEPNGWLLVEFEVEEQTPFHLKEEHEHGVAEGRHSSFTTFLMTSDGNNGGSGTGGSSGSIAMLAVQGTHTRCCDGLVREFPGMPAQTGGGAGEAKGELRPNETYLLGIIVANVRDLELDVKLTTATPVKLGALKTGTSVELRKLAEEAREAGTGAEVGYHHVAVSTPDVRAAWTPEHAGFLRVFVDSVGNASADVSVGLPDQEPFTAHVHHGSAYVLAHGPGDYSVGLARIHEPLTLPGQYERLDASVLFADMPLPGSSVRTWSGPFG